MATSSKVGYSAMSIKLLDNIMCDENRNIEVYGDVLVALRLSMLGYNLVSDHIILWFSFFCPFSLQYT